MTVRVENRGGIVACRYFEDARLGRARVSGRDDRINGDEGPRRVHRVESDADDDGDELEIGTVLTRRRGT